VFFVVFAFAAVVFFVVIAALFESDIVFSFSEAEMFLAAAIFLVAAIAVLFESAVVVVRCSEAAIIVVIVALVSTQLSLLALVIIAESHVFGGCLIFVVSEMQGSHFIALPLYLFLAVFGNTSRRTGFSYWTLEAPRTSSAFPSWATLISRNTTFTSLANWARESRAAR
jgi:hypothetical protein